MNDVLAQLIELIIQLLPDEVVEEINAVSLNELDARGLIIWADGGNDAGACHLFYKQFCLVNGQW